MDLEGGRPAAVLCSPALKLVQGGPLSRLLPSLFCHQVRQPRPRLQADAQPLSIRDGGQLAAGNESGGGLLLHGSRPRAQGLRESVRIRPFSREAAPKLR